MRKGIFWLLTAVALLGLGVAGCSLFTDTSGNGNLRFANANEIAYTQTDHSDLVEGCFLNVMLREANNRWVWTVEQWPFPACQHDFEYVIRSGESVAHSTTLHGYDNFSWIVYSNYQNYDLVARKSGTGDYTHIASLSSN